MPVSRHAKSKAAMTSVPLDPGLTELLRVMDVAGAVRRSPHSAERLRTDLEFRDQLRRSVVQGARQCGDLVDEPEIDAAIEAYLARRRVYADPPWSLSVAAARLWVHRRRLLVVAAIVLLALAVLWLLFAVVA